ncbi:hypothetical protein PG988_004493 [Apiospora saccharicola]
MAVEGCFDLSSVSDSLRPIADHTSASGQDQCGDTDIDGAGRQPSLRVSSGEPPIADTTRPDPADITPHRRPSYLRRRVLLAFLVIFVLMAAAVETLFFVSKQNNGIAPAAPNQHCLWTYGPSAILTVLAAMWSRVEYQSKLVVPWIRPSQPGVPASRSILRDYISQFPQFALFTSLLDHDFLVSITIATSITITIAIVVSTGLITLTTVSVGTEYLMVIQDTFVDIDTRLSSVGTIPFSMLQGLVDGNISSPPNGMFGGLAFPSVRTDMPAGVETRVTVDGLSNSLDCNPVNVKVNDISL